MSEKRMNDDLAGVEAILGSLTPAASSVDRDRLMFLAGRASVERLPTPPVQMGTRLLPTTLAASLAAMTSLAAILLVMLVAERGEQAAGGSVGPTATSVASSATAAITPADGSYRTALRRGRDDKLRVLTGADTALPDDFFGPSNSVASNAIAPAGRAETTEERLNSLELMRRILREPGLIDAPFHRSSVEPSNRTGSKL